MANSKTQTSIRFNTSTLNKLDNEADRLGVTRTHMLDRIIHEHFTVEADGGLNLIRARVRNLESAMALFVASGK